MPIPLPKDASLALSVAEGDTMTVTVSDGGPVDVSEDMAGPFGEVAQTIEPGASADLTRPVHLRAQADAQLDVAYASQEVPPLEPMPEVKDD